MDGTQRTEFSRLVVDQSAYNYTESQAAATTYAGSMARQNPEDDGRTTTSTYSHRSGMDAAKFLKEVHGRTINATNDTYFLPTDDEEWNRLDKQHTAIVLGVGGLYPAAANVPALLRSEAGETRHILDLGCGTGVWTLAMAREWPSAQVVGIDLAPVPIEHESLPLNCRFEVDDINLGLAHFEGQFDFVHARLIGSGLKDFRKSMLDIEKCLKPGGLVLWLDADYDLYSHKTFIYKPPISEVSPTGVWLQRLLYEMRRSAVLGGSDIHSMEKELDKGLWDHPMIDPETCKTASLYLPIGPWVAGGNPEQDQYSNYIGSLIRQDTKSVHRAVHPLLIRSGWSRETVHEWSDKADEEIASMKDKMSWRIRMAWGRRRAGDTSLAPALLAMEDDPGAPGRSRFPHFYIYSSQEESLAQADQRSRDKALVAPRHPSEVRKDIDNVPN